MSASLRRPWRSGGECRDLRGPPGHCEPGRGVASEGGHRRRSCRDGFETGALDPAPGRLRRSCRVLAILVVRSFDFGNRDGLVVLEDAVRAGMTAIGASLLEGMLIVDPTHRIERGQRIWPCFLLACQGHRHCLLSPIRLKHAFYHCKQCLEGCNAMMELAAWALRFPESRPR